MPQRNGRDPDDEAREHTALPDDYGGPERRKPGLGTELHRAVAVGSAAGAAAATATEPVWLRGIPTPWRAFINAGFVGLFVVLFGVYFWDNRAALSRYDSERRARDAEEREIRRAEQAQQDRRNDTLTTELRSIGQKFDAMANKLDGIASEYRAANTEIRNSSRLLDRLARELKELVDKLLNKGKAVHPQPDVELQVPTFGLWPAVAPWRMPELAPMPREVRVPVVRHPRPCETQAGVTR